MGLREVRALVEACEGLPDAIHLEQRASRLTVGDLRLLLHCADAVAGEYREQQWPQMLDPHSNAVKRAD